MGAIHSERPAFPPRHGRIVGEFDPDRRMIARPWPAPHRPIDAPRLHSRRKVGAQEDMVEAKAGIPLPPIAQVVPECVDPRLAVHLAQGIRPALLDEAGRRRREL